MLFEAGSSGLLPKDLAVKLGQFKVHRFQVSRRILRITNVYRTNLVSILRSKEVGTGQSQVLLTKLGEKRKKKRCDAKCHRPTISRNMPKIRMSKDTIRLKDSSGILFNTTLPANVPVITAAEDRIIIKRNWLTWLNSVKK